MMRSSPRVVYTGRAQHAWAAVVCSSCGAGIGHPCVWNRHTGPVPHAVRRNLADAIGLRDMQEAPLLEMSICNRY